MTPLINFNTMKLKSHMDKYEIGKIVTVIMIVIFVLWLISQVLSVCNYGEIVQKPDNMSILLSFIGILATFIVIGNFSQTSHLMADSRERLREYSERIEKGEEAKKEVSVLNEKVNELAEDLKKLDGKSSQSSLVEEKDLAQLLRLFVGIDTNWADKMALYSKFLVENDIYSIKYKDGSDMTALIRLNTDNNIELCENGNENAIIDIEKIDTICGVKFDYTNILFAYRLLHQINEQMTGELNNDNTRDNEPITGETTR